MAADLIVGSGDAPSGDAEWMTTLHACADEFRTVVAAQVSLRSSQIDPERAWLMASALLALVSALRTMTRHPAGSTVPDGLAGLAATTCGAHRDVGGRHIRGFLKRHVK